MAADEILTYPLQGVERTAILQRPAAAASGRPAPGLILLHGGGESGAIYKKWYGFDIVADREGFVAVYPDAIDKAWNYGRPYSGEATKIGAETVDDIGFIRRLIDDLIAREIADPDRIYVAGNSLGALMTYAVACSLSDKIAAAAALVGSMTEHQAADCLPVRPLPMMLIAGTNDYMLPYDGWLYPNGRVLSVVETLEHWRRLSGCSGQTFKRLPHLNRDDRTRVEVIEWTGCRKGAELRLFKVVGGGHRTPRLSLDDNPATAHKFGRRNYDFEAAEEIWKFVKQYAKGG
jgi:polyhydroxybutyrate depolymerase